MNERVPSCITVSPNSNAAYWNNNIGNYRLENLQKPTIMSSRLTDTDIKRAAQQYLQGIEDNLEHDLMDACMPHDEMDDIEEYITDAFTVGAKWGAQRTVQNLWHDASEVPPRYDTYIVKTKQGCIGMSHYAMEIWHQPYICGGDVELWLDLAELGQ